MAHSSRPERWLIRHRWSVLVTLDVCAWTLSLMAFAVLRFFDTPEGVPWARALTGVAIAVGVHLALGSVLWLYDGRYVVGSREEAAAASAAFLGTTVLLELSDLLLFDGNLLTLTTRIAGGLGALVLGVGARLGWGILGDTESRPRTGTPALILGAGSGGEGLVASMMAARESPYLPVGFLDDDPGKRHLHVHGIPVLGNRTALKAASERTGAEVLIVAIPSGRSELFRDVAESASVLGLTVKVLPSLASILDGEVGVKDLRDIDVTDLLGRRPVHTDLDACSAYIEGKRVLVTGAGGSIGSELCRQLVRFRPGSLLMLDRDESALHSLQLSLTGRALLDGGDLLLADIRDPEALDEVFQRHRPEVVFHAAALKHLPMLEQCPEEAWKTNVLGTANVLEAARGAACEVFVNISTDKAANPQSVLGYSKRIAERLTAGLAEECPGRYVSVRFGNVLGSRGSVLPAFAEEITRGGPVTVTDPEVTRYFMMIPEACELVIQAAAIGHDGEVLVLDMGQPVKILDVARQMIRMSGRKDVEIVFTGLRPGEKLNEALFSHGEGQHLTTHELITAVPVPPLQIAEVRESAVDWAPAAGA